MEKVYVRYHQLLILTAIRGQRDLDCKGNIRENYNLSTLTNPKLKEGLQK